MSRLVKRLKSKETWISLREQLLLTLSDVFPHQVTRGRRDRQSLGRLELQAKREKTSEYILYSLESSFTSYVLSPEKRCPSGFSLFKNNCRLSCYTDWACAIRRADLHSFTYQLYSRNFDWLEIWNTY